MEGRARFTEVAPSHKPLKRKRLSPVAIPMQLANALPDSFLYARLSQFEKRIDATLSEKLNRIKEGVVQSEQGTQSLRKDKYRIHLFFTTEKGNVEKNASASLGQEQRLGQDGEKDKKPKGNGQSLLIYGSVQKFKAAPKPNCSAEGRDNQGKDEKKESQADMGENKSADDVRKPENVNATVASASGMELDEKRGEEEKEEKFYLTDVLKSVTVTGQKLNLNMDEQKAYDLVSFTWNNCKEEEEEDHKESVKSRKENAEKPSNCLRLDCSSLLPGSAVHVTWEVKGQPEKFILPDVLSRVLQVKVDTKKNITSRLWKHMKLKQGLPTSIEPASVEFTHPTLKTFFAEGERSTSADLKVSSIGKKLSACLKETQKPKIKCILPKGNEDTEVMSLSFVADMEILDKEVREKRTHLTAAVGKTSVAIQEIDKDIRKLVEEIIERKTRRNFFTGFSQSPVDFVSSLVDSQKRDLMTLRDFQVKYPTSYSQRASTFRDVHDAAIRYLHQKLSSNQ